VAKKFGFLKFFVLILCLIIAPSFAACELVTINYNKQLAEVVASFDGSVELSREELIILYNSVGRSRYDSSGAATKEGIESTIELGLDRAILVDLLTNKDKASERERLGVEEVVLSSNEIHDIWWSVYDYINSTVLELENGFRREDKLDTWPTEESDDETDSTAYTPYEKTYEVQKLNNVYSLVKLPKEKEVVKNEDALFDVNADLSVSEKAMLAYKNFRTKYWNQHDSMELTGNVDKTKTSYSDKAWNKYIQNLKVNESKRNLSAEVEEVFLRDVERVYKIYYQNAVLNNFQERYTEALTVLKSDVVSKFLELYNAQKEQFTINPSSFDSLIPTQAEQIYYMKNDDYFKVNHILVKFTDEQSSAIQSLETKLTNGEITTAEYNAGVAQIKADTKAYNRDTQEYEPYTQVLEKLNAALLNVQSENEKFVIFREFMHRYSEDTATLNADSCYYIPKQKTDANGKSLDTMQEEFADTSRELYETGEVGKYSDFIETTYGYHIIMYTGEAQSILAAGSEDEILTSLDSYKLNPLYNKTMLDIIIEKVVLNTYTSYEKTLLGRVKADKEIVYYPQAYSDLYSD